MIVALFVPAKGKYDTSTFLEKVRYFPDKIDCADGSCWHTILLNQNHLTAVQAVEVSCHHTITPLQRLEHGLNPWVSLFIIPLLALANAGEHVET